MNPAYPGILAILLYILGSYSQLQTLNRRAPGEARRLLALAIPAVTLHGLTVYLVAYGVGNGVDGTGGVDLSLFTIASVIAFALTFTVVIASFSQPLHNLYIFVFPLSIVAVAGSLLFGGTQVRTDLDDGLVTHIIISIVAYTALTMAAFQAILLSIHERQIRTKEPIAIIRILPPLQTMEAMLFQLLWIGLIFLTLSIASGFIFLDDMFAQHVAHHTVLASASWAAYVILLGGHYVLGWRGATATRWTLVAFGLLALGYFGSKFVLEFILGPR